MIPNYQVWDFIFKQKLRLLSTRSSYFQIKKQLVGSAGNFRILFIAGAIGCTLTSCFTPVNTHFERAASLEKDQVELLGSASGNYVINQERFGTTNLGFRFGYGLNSRTDLKLFYRMQLNDEENLSTQHLAFYPKFSFFSNTLALQPTLGAYIFGGTGGSEVTFVFSPRVVYSMPISEHIELSLSSKLDFFLDGNDNTLWGFNIGSCFFSQNRTVSYRPELGILVLPGETPALWTFGMAYVRILE